MRFALILAFFCASAANAAFDDAPLNVPMHLDINGTWGYSSAKGQTVTSSTSLGQWTGGITIAPRLGDVIFIGLSSDFRSTAQYSDVSTFDGNFSGRRWNMASPTLGFRRSGFVVKFDYQMLGDYELRSKTADGASVKYTQPQGWRAALMYKMTGIIHVSGFYEGMTYGKKMDSSLGETTLSDKLKLSQFGVGLGLVF
jgi:hypothetical protein